MKDNHGRISLDDVDRMLSARFPPGHEDDGCGELARVSLGLDPDASDAERTAARAHLRACDECMETVMAAAAWDPTPVPEMARSVVEASRGGRARGRRLPEARRHGGTRWWSRSGWGVAAVAVAALLAVVFVPPDETSPGSPASPNAPGRLSPKGQADRFELAVRRGGEEFVARPGATLQRGDALGFFYSAERSGHLAVLHSETSGPATVLYPCGRRHSAAILAGRDVALPDGGVVESPSGCEWLVAVFSDGPLDLSTLTDTLSDAARDVNTCELRPTVPGARAVIVFPVRTGPDARERRSRP